MGMQRLLDFRGTARYSPKRLLGMGGMGAVYEVEDSLTHARVALKIMIAQEPLRLLRFKQEFRLAAELNHKNLVRLFDLEEDAGRWFFTMELVDGCDLLKRLQPSDNQDESTLAGMSGTVDEPALHGDLVNKTASALPREIEPFRAAMVQILDALEFLHSHGIVHRDLKPNNVLVEPNGAVRLLDFGLASRMEPNAALEASGAIIGTLGYLSPEQCQGEPATPASDLYALGCMMFQLLTGQLPFVGTPSQVIHAHKNRPPPRVQRRVSWVPEEMAEICFRLLSKKPEDRPSLREVRDALGRNGENADDDMAHGHPARGTSNGRNLFVGRKKELDTLMAHLQQAKMGTMQWVLVSGQSGIGKSTLSSNLVIEAERLGFLCIHGRCYERERVPFVAFDRAIDALIAELMTWSQERREPLLDSLDLLQQVFPGIHLLLSDRRKNNPLLRTIADPHERYRCAAGGLCQLLVECQRQTPLLVVIDDLQWADEESIELLSTLVAQSRGRIFILGLTRPEGLETANQLSRLLPLVNAQITLTGLTRVDVQKLAIQVATTEIDDIRADELLAQSDGNPFLLLQLLGYLAAPQLSSRAERLLAVAATAHGDSSRALLATASGLSISDFDLALAELLSGRVLKALPVPGAEGKLERLDLYHDRIRESTYRQLNPEYRRELHREHAMTLEAQSNAKDGTAPFEALLKHWTEAGDHAKRLFFTSKAAEQAAEKLAFRRAAELFRVLLEEISADEPPLVLAARWEQVAAFYEYGGQLKEACQGYEQALRIWEACPEDTENRQVALLRLRGRVAESLMATFQVARGLVMYAKGLETLDLPIERTIPERLAVIGWLKLKLVLAPLTTKLQWRRPGKTEFETTQLRFLDEMVRAFVPLWSLPTLEIMSRCELLAQRIADKQLLHRIRVNKVLIASLLTKSGPKRLAEFHTLLDQAEEDARTHQIRLGTEIVRVTRAGLFFWAKDYVRTREEIDSALAGFAKQGLTDAYDSHVARMLYMHCLYNQGDGDALLAIVERERTATYPNFYNLVVALCYKARVLAERGEHDGAEVAIGRASELLAPIPPCDLKIFQHIATIAVFTSKREFDKAFAAVDAAEQFVKNRAGPLIEFYRSHLLEVFLNAALELGRQRKIPPTIRSKARNWASSLVRGGIIDFPSVGHRGLALLAHAESRKNEARKEMEQALSSSRTNANPRRRWLCLLAAKTLRMTTPEMDEEAAEIARKHGFV